MNAYTNLINCFHALELSYDFPRTMMHQKDGNYLGIAHDTYI